MVSCNFVKKFYVPIMILVKFTSGADLLKHAMTFFKWNYRVQYHECGTWAILKKSNENSNYRQNMWPINLDEFR